MPKAIDAHSLFGCAVVRIPAGEVWRLSVDSELSSALPDPWMGQLGLYTYGGKDILAGIELLGGAVFSPEFGS